MNYTEASESFRLISGNGVLLCLKYNETFGAAEPEAEASGDY